MSTSPLLEATPAADLLAPPGAGLSGRAARAAVLARSAGRRQGWLARQATAQAMRWPLFYPLGLMLGAGGYVWSPIEPDWAWLGGGLILTVLAVGLTRRRAGGVLAFLAILALCTVGGAMAGKVRAALVASPMLAREIGPARIEGVVTEIDASNSSRRIRIEARAIEGLTPEQTPRFVRISHRSEIIVGPGRSVSCLAVLSPPPRPVAPGDYEFHRDAWFQQLGGVGFAIGQCKPLPDAAPANAWQAATRWIGALRRAIAQHANEVAGAGGGMTAAMLVGDRSFLTAEDSDALRDSGLAHLLSISGVHMVLAGGIFFLIVRLIWPLCEPLALRVPVVKAAALAAILAVTLYFAISGGSVATQRAYVMALIGFGAKLFDRPAVSLRSLAVALSVVVLLQPESVATPGFQMSFAASAGLIALYEVWPRLGRGALGPGLRMRVAGWAVATVATSLVASAATMPFALHHFDRTAVMSVVANVVVEPLIGLATTPAAAVAVLMAPFGLETPFLWLMGKSLEAVLWVAHQCAEIDPGIDAPRLPALGLAFASAGIITVCLFNGWARLLSLAPLAAAGWVWAQAPRTAAYVAGDGSVFVRAETGWIEMTDWRGANGLDPMAVRDAKSKEPCPGRQAACAFAGRYGRWRVETLGPEALSVRETAPAGVVTAIDAAAPTSGQGRARQPKPKFAPCPPLARIVFTPAGGPDAAFDPCALGKAGGAAIEVREGRAWARQGGSDAARPWGQGGR